MILYDSPVFIFALVASKSAIVVGALKKVMEGRGWGANGKAFLLVLVLLPCVDKKY